MSRNILMYKNKITNIRGHVFGDINIGNGVTIVTTTAGTFEIRILKIFPGYPDEHKIVVVGCRNCTLNVGSREIQLELLDYDSDYYLTANEIANSFKPIARVEHPLTDSFVDECLESTETPLNHQAAVKYLTHLINDLEVVAESIYTLKRVFIDKQKQHLESVPVAASTTLKNLANQLLKILEEEEKNI